MLYEINDAQKEAILNLINTAEKSQGAACISLQLNTIGRSLNPISDERLKELGYVKAEEVNKGE